MIFDCHVHLPSPGLHLTWEWEACTPSLEAAVATLRRCGVERALANNVRGELARTVSEMTAANDEVHQAARQYPGFIVPACLVNPNLPEALAELRRCHDELGMFWLGELCGYAAGYQLAGPAFEGVLSRAGELDMVVQLHDDDAQQVSGLCAQFPALSFVLAHLGDTPEEVRERIRLAEDHPNLYLDICGNGFERMGVLERAVEAAGPERILFGSDYTINDPSGVIARVRNSRLDQDTQDKILGGNLQRLLEEHGWQ